MSSQPTSKWFLVPRPKPLAEYRLFCFPYAGGSATAYAAWEALLPRHVELVAVQPPGRANRLNEPLLTSIEDMVEQIVRVIPAWLDRPYLIYGHSLGAAVSFDLLHALDARGLPLPVHYFCGARRAPQLPPRIPPVHDYPLERFKTELKSLNGTPAAVLDNADLMEIFVPILRTDFKAAYGYLREPDVRLRCPASVFGGARDEKVLPEDLDAWAEHFGDDVEIRIFDGGHFFMDENRAEVVDAICARARPAQATGVAHPAIATAGHR